MVRAAPSALAPAHWEAVCAVDAGGGEGGGGGFIAKDLQERAGGYISELAEVGDWEEAQTTLEAHAVWQAALAEPPKTISLTASFDKSSSSWCSATGTPSAASPLCTEMSEACALARLCQSLAPLLASQTASAAGAGRGGHGGGGASKAVWGGQGGAGIPPTPLLQDDDGEAFLERLEPWISAGSLSLCRVLTAIHDAARPGPHAPTSHHHHPSFSLHAR